MTAREVIDDVTQEKSIVSSDCIRSRWCPTCDDEVRPSNPGADILLCDRCGGPTTEWDRPTPLHDDVPSRSSRARGPTWQEVSYRTSSGALDDWEETLCFRHVPMGIEIGICGREWLGEVPADWYDEETGELFLEYQDEHGLPMCPPTIDGRRVTGVEGEAFVGDLVPVTDDASVVIREVSWATLREALEGLDWSIDDLPELEVAIMRG